MEKLKGNMKVNSIRRHKGSSQSLEEVPKPEVFTVLSLKIRGFLHFQHRKSPRPISAYADYLAGAPSIKLLSTRPLIAPGERRILCRHRRKGPILCLVVSNGEHDELIIRHSCRLLVPGLTSNATMQVSRNTQIGNSVQARITVLLCMAQTYQHMSRSGPWYRA